MIKRYNHTDMMEEEEGGKWVKYEDYAKLMDRFTKTIETQIRFNASVEEALDNLSKGESTPDKPVGEQTIAISKHFIPYDPDNPQGVGSIMIGPNAGKS